MGFDINDGIRLGLQHAGVSEVKIISDNVGFGEDSQLNHSKAEQLVMNEDVDLIVAYATSLNAESLYEFSKTASKPILFLDAGMEIFEAPISPLCFHLTLQGLQACKIIGANAAQGGKNIIAATSFYDGGYRGPWAIVSGIESSHGKVVANYVTVFKPEEFSVDPLIQFINNSGASAVTACFSMYLTELLMKGLKERSPNSTSLPFFCSPFMAEEVWLEKCDFPGGTFHTVVPWSSSLENPAQEALQNALIQKNKKANLFSLLGWEAGLVVAQILNGGVSSLENWSFESPRGTVTFNADTHCSFAPLYNGQIVAGENDKAKLITTSKIDVTPEDHLTLFNMRIDGEYTRWRNNYFSI